MGYSGGDFLKLTEFFLKTLVIRVDLCYFAAQFVNHKSEWTCQALKKE